MSVHEVKEYADSESFRKGLDKQTGLGWLLESWQAVPVLNENVLNKSGYIIIAVYRGR